MKQIFFSSPKRKWLLTNNTCLTSLSNSSKSLDFRTAFSSDSFYSEYSTLFQACLLLKLISQRDQLWLDAVRCNIIGSFLFLLLSCIFFSFQGESSYVSQFSFYLVTPQCYKFFMIMGLFTKVCTIQQNSVQVNSRLTARIWSANQCDMYENCTVLTYYLNLCSQ